jgi:hypothetical protein
LEVVIVLRIVLGIAHVISGGGLQVQARGRDSGVPEKLELLRSMCESFEEVKKLLPADLLLVVRIE